MARATISVEQHWTKSVTNLAIADDVAILSEPLESLVCSKSKIQASGVLLGEPVQSIQACGDDVEVTESFTYLGCTVYFSWLSDQEVGKRTDLAAGDMNSVNKSILRCQYPCRTKLRVFKALILPVLLSGSETWTLYSAMDSRLGAFCN
ncbi:uncharacterized protein [Penaeus vannamei]|uniref:uncharacterized protein n=1 Tax=Penaeus vannamei TaxID=6689 RepID=UPI00387F4D21